MKADLLVRNAGQLCTLAGHGGRPAAGRAQGEVGAVSGGAVAALEGRIVAAGPEREVLGAVEPLPGAVTIDAGGKLVTPGLVDSHTHLCFAGWRAEEFGMRVGGAAYLEILKAGGGILNTVRATRAATEDELARGVATRLHELLRLGTTTVEVKSGYGLDLPTERKQLRAIRRAARWAAGLGETRDPGRSGPEGAPRGGPVNGGRPAADAPDALADLSPTGQEVVATFLGAHAVPPEYRGRGGEYAELVAREMVPAVAREGLAEFVDVFCEDGAFTAEETARILRAARDAGLGRKVHADEVNHLGGVRIAAELGAVSADHLAVTPPEDFAALREAGTIACLLPATSFFLMKPEHAPARAMIEAGVPVALASDYNPGTQPGGSLPLVMTIACLLLRMTPEEALVAVTMNAARAIGRAGEVGSLEPGKRADVVVWDCPTLDHLPYRMGTNLAHTVVTRGRVRIEAGRWVAS